MFILANLISALAGVLETVLNIYMIIVIVAALITWVSPDPYNPIVRFLYAMTEPVFSFIRRKIPLPFSGIDISPIIVILIIIFLKLFLVQTLMQIAARM
jgi:YggT family protein